MPALIIGAGITWMILGAENDDSPEIEDRTFHGADDPPMPGSPGVGETEPLPGVLPLLTANTPVKAAIVIGWSGERSQALGSRKILSWRSRSVKFTSRVGVLPQLPQYACPCRFSEHTEKTVSHATNLASRFEAKLTLLHIFL
jgi:hypothetical protein